MAASTNSTLLDDLSKKPDPLQVEFGSDGEVRQPLRKGRVDSFRHKKLLDAIGSLGGKNKVTTRTEPSLTVSEYDLSKASVEKVAVHQLLMNLKKTDVHRQIKRKVRSIVRNAKVLAEPLPQPQQQRMQRQVAYEKVGEEITVWEPVVRQNRVAKQLRFPLKQPEMRMESAAKFTQRFEPKTDLERQIDNILKVSENVTPPGAELTPAEEKALKAMSLEEAKERLAELKKMRALMSYQEMKARRQAKIKSKKYHRILKKERLRKEMKEFEELKEKNPELAIEKLKELEKQRILERVSLRHKGTGKWAKQQMLRTKYNQESREALLKQLELSRQLTQKPLVESSDDEDAVDSNAAGEVAATYTGELEASFFSSANPWLKKPSGARPSAAVFNGKVPEDVENEKDANADLDDDGEEDNDENSNEGQAMQAGGAKNGQECLASETAAVEAEAASCGTDEKEKESASSSKLNRAGEVKQVSVEKGAKRKLAQVAETRGEVSVRDSEPAKPPLEEQEVVNIDRVFDSLSERATKRRKKMKPGQKKRKEINKFTVTPIRKKEASKEENNEPDKTIEDPESSENEAQLDETLERKQTLKDLESFSQEKMPKPAAKQRSSLPKPTQSAAEPDKVEVDPTRFIEVKQQILKSRAPDLGGTAEDALDDEDIEEEQAVTIAEAFADDDVISAFREEKKAQVKQDTPQGVDLYLPGWGSWAGPGIKVDKKKRRRFYVKPPPAPPRKDRTLGNVIISEAKDEKLEAHQVDDLPFPFNNVSQFESVISHPVGSLWNPETSFRELTAPKVVTKIGQVIDPMDRDALTVKKKENVVDKLLEQKKAAARQKQSPRRQRKKK